MTNNQLTDGVIDTWFNAAKAAIHHPATPRKEHSHAFAAYTLAQEVKRLRAELQERRNAAMDSDPVAWMVIDIDTGERIIRCDRSYIEGPCQPLYRHAQPAPVLPDGYVMVPKEPTETMINAWLSEVANWRGHVAGYKAMLAVAPQEVK